MKKESIWLEGITFNKEKELTNNLQVDVLIIGGGITGISTAYHLRSSNLKIAIVEKNNILHGVTSRTTGKLTYLQDNIYTKLKDKAKIYYNSQKETIKMVEKIIKDNNIDCNYQKVDSYLFTNKVSEIDKIKKEEEMLTKLGIDYTTHKILPFDIKYKYLIKVSDTAVFHPIKYLLKLRDIIVKKGINIYENSKVTKIVKENDSYLCYVGNLEIKAKKVVIASHYPFFLLPFFLPIKTSIEKSYLSASIVDNIKLVSAITVSKPTKSFRYHEDNNKYFIYLNGSHNLATKYNYKDNFVNLIKDLNKLKLKPSFIWSNHDIITEDNLPYIGYIDDNLLIGTGYNTWGMTNGSLAGKLLSDLILGNKNEYQELFDPKRNKKLINYLKYPLNIGYNTKSFVENKIITNKKWYPDNVRFENINGKKIAIYTDEYNKEHKVYNLCPHLKCSLIFNEVEKTWDCPCHGSRFDIDGKCIFGPSNKDIGYKK